MAGIWNPVFLMFALLLYVSMQGVNGRPQNIAESSTRGNTNDVLNIKGSLVALQTTSAELGQILKYLSHLLSCVNDMTFDIQNGARDLSAKLVKGQLLSCVEDMNEDIQNKASDLPAKVGQLSDSVNVLSENFKRAATMDLAEGQSSLMLGIQIKIIPKLGEITIKLGVVVNTAKSLNEQSERAITMASREGSGNVKTGLVQEITSILRKLSSILDRVNPQLIELNKCVATMLAGDKAAGGGDSVTKVLAPALDAMEAMNAQLNKITTTVTGSLAKLVETGNAKLVETGNAELAQILNSLKISELVSCLMTSVTGVIGGDLLGLPLLANTLKTLKEALAGQQGPLPIVGETVKGVVEMVPKVFDTLGEDLLKSPLVSGILTSVTGLVGQLGGVLDEVLPSVTGLANALPGGVLGA